MLPETRVRSTGCVLFCFVVLVYNIRIRDESTDAFIFT